MCRSSKIGKGFKYWTKILFSITFIRLEIIATVGKNRLKSDGTGNYILRDTIQTVEKNRKVE